MNPLGMLARQVERTYEADPETVVDHHGRTLLKCCRPIHVSGVEATTTRDALRWIVKELDAAEDKRIDAPMSAQAHLDSAREIAWVARAWLEEVAPRPTASSPDPANG